ncbi:hypothetical protein BD309DRAFT_154672 [Dichomitus squalens]|nr:hypothetical protein BD309DRAFT_154672 [Dichomitus squalens]
MGTEAGLFANPVSRPPPRQHIGPSGRSRAAAEQTQHLISRESGVSDPAPYLDQSNGRPRLPFRNDRRRRGGRIAPAKWWGGTRILRIDSVPVMTCLICERPDSLSGLKIISPHRADTTCGDSCGAFSLSSGAVQCGNADSNCEMMVVIMPFDAPGHVSERKYTHMDRE